MGLVPTWPMICRVQAPQLAQASPSKQQILPPERCHLVAPKLKSPSEAAKPSCKAELWTMKPLGGRGKMASCFVRSQGQSQRNSLYDVNDFRDRSEALVAPMARKPIVFCRCTVPLKPEAHTWLRYLLQRHTASSFYKKSSVSRMFNYVQFFECSTNLQGQNLGSFSQSFERSSSWSKHSC